MIYYIGKVFAYILLNITGGVSVKGIENIPKEGPLLIVSNHQSIIDPFVLMYCFPRRITFLAASYLFRIPLIRWIIYLGGAMPIKGAGDATTLKKALKLLEQGGVIGIFPEGGVSLDGKLKPFMQGWAYLALKSGTPVVPTAVNKSKEVLPVGKYIPRRRRIEVAFGETLEVEKKDKVRKADIKSLNAVMEEKMLKLYSEIGGMV